MIWVLNLIQRIKLFYYRHWACVCTLIQSLKIKNSYKRIFDKRNFLFRQKAFYSETERLSWVVRIKRVYGFCFKELCSSCKSPSHSAHSSLELYKFLRNWSSNLIPYRHKKPFTKRQKAFYSETERFELSVQVTPHNTLAGCRLKPTRPRFQKRPLHNNIN